MALTGAAKQLDASMRRISGGQGCDPVRYLGCGLFRGPAQILCVETGIAMTIAGNCPKLPV